MSYIFQCDTHKVSTFSKYHTDIAPVKGNLENLQLARPCGKDWELIIRNSFICQHKDIHQTIDCL